MRVIHNDKERLLTLYTWYGSLIAVIEYDENRVILKQAEFQKNALATLKEKFFYLNLTEDLRNTNHLIYVSNIDIIGTLCIDDKLQGFLHYAYKYSNKEVECGDDKFWIDQIHSQAEVFCALNGVNLTMY